MNDNTSNCANLTTLSIIIPILNEATVIAETLRSIVYSLRENPLAPTVCEIVVVDGGSNDGSVTMVEDFMATIDLATMNDSRIRFRVIHAVSGRARQMNLGASHASGELLVFLHADTIVPSVFIAELEKVSKSKQYQWGRFDVSLSGSHPMLRCVEWFMCQRSRLTSVATGDQAIFIKRDTFNSIEGFALIPLMEDVEICKRLRQVGQPYCSSHKVLTSSRRWENNGVYKTIFLMWKLRYAYYRGADPQSLAEKY